MTKPPSPRAPSFYMVWWKHDKRDHWRRYSQDLLRHARASAAYHRQQGQIVMIYHYPPNAKPKRIKP